MKKNSKRKKRYTDVAVYQISIGVPITYYASKHDLYSRLCYPEKQITKYRHKIEELIKSAGYDDYKVSFDGFEVPF